MSSLNTSKNEMTKARKVRAACVNCHNKKVRCDANKRGFPCSNCITHQRSNCRKHEKRKRRSDRLPGDYVPIREKHLETTSSIETSNSFSSSSPNLDSRTSGSNNGADSKLVEFVGPKEFRDRSILRGLRITYLGKDVSNVNFLVRQRDGHHESAYHFPTEDIARQFINHEPEGIPREALILPERPLSDELVEAYFTHVNPGCPIVDRDIFMERYENNPTKPVSLLLLQAILVVGAHVARNGSDREALKTMFFRRAKMLYDARLEKNRDFVIQAALLLTWHSDGPDETQANSWFWTGIAARTALGMGLHRNRGSSKITNTIDMRTWKRIWWILVQFDVSVSLFYGQPQALNLDESDVPMLDASDFEGCGPNVQINYIIRRTELFILISKILRDRFGLKTSQEDRKAALTNADEALANWNLNLPPSLQLHSPNMTLWTVLLHLTFNNFLILLHRPHPRASSESRDHGPNDADICSSSANAIAAIFEDLRAKDHIKYLWISDFNALFTTMVQLSVELRFSNPILALNALRRFDSTLLSLRSVVEYWPNADWILRIFEESSQIQHGNRLGKGSLDTQATHDEPTDERLEPDVLADAAHVASDSPVTSTGNRHDESNDWTSFVSPNESAPPDFLLTSEMMNLDSEWREIYWQEPGISGSFGNGICGWP